MSSEIFKRLNLRGFQVGKQIPLRQVMGASQPSGLWERIRTDMTTIPRILFRLSEATRAANL